MLFQILLYLSESVDLGFFVFKSNALLLRVQGLGTSEDTSKTDVGCKLWGPGLHWADALMVETYWLGGGGFGYP